MALILAKTFAVFDVDLTASLRGPSTGRDDVLINAVLATQPVALTGMTGQQLQSLLDHATDIDDRVDRVVTTQPKLLLRQLAERAPRHAALRALAIPQGQ